MFSLRRCRARLSCDVGLSLTRCAVGILTFLMVAEICSAHQKEQGHTLISDSNAKSESSPNSILNKDGTGHRQNTAIASDSGSGDRTTPQQLSDLDSIFSVYHPQQQENENSVYSNEFVVKMPGSTDLVRQLAEYYGYIYLGPVRITCMPVFSFFISESNRANPDYKQFYVVTL